MWVSSVWVFLLQISSFIITSFCLQLAYTARGATSTLSTSETCRSSFIFFPLPPYSFHTAGWKSSSLLLFCLTSKENIHRPLSRTGRVQHNVAVYRLLHGLVLYAKWLSSREASRISTSSHLQEYSFTQLHSFKEVLLALHHSIIQGGFIISPSSISDLLLRVHESGNSSRICHPLDR